MSGKRESNRLLDTVNEKISELISDFQDNKLSREQFNIIYSRYNRQLNLVLSVMSDGSGTAKVDSMSTNSMNEASRSRADGYAIYNQSSNILLETLGEYTLTSEQIVPLLEDFSNSISPKIISLDEQWLIILSGKVTTVVLQYADAPDERYFPSLKRLMADFENANSHLLTHVDNGDYELAQPFICAIKSVKK